MLQRTEKSQAAFERACRVLVGGVNSPVRAFGAVGGNPPIIASAKGARITDADGNCYVDYVGSYGPAILGHAFEPVVEAVKRAVERGLSFGATHEAEVRLAELVISAIPSIRKLRLTSSGTEAAMTAVRLTRGATGRSKIVKCTGCYHGHADPLLVEAGSGAMTLGVPNSPGVPVSAAADTLLAPYNDKAAMDALFAAHGRDIAAVLVEPVAGNMGVIAPMAGYLRHLRDLCDRNNAVLVFDEVMSGFRVHPGGAQALYGVRPDLTILGKIIGGGLPVGAVGGSAELMDHLAPLGKVYQAGTLSGNPVSVAAGIATLEQLAKPGFYQRLERTSADLENALRLAGTKKGLENSIQINRVGSMLTIFFTPGPVIDYASAGKCDTSRFAKFFHAMLDAGIYLPPSQFETMFVSAAHQKAEIDATIEASERAFSIIAG